MKWIETDDGFEARINGYNWTLVNSIKYPDRWFLYPSYPSNNGGVYLVAKDIENAKREAETIIVSSLRKTLEKACGIKSFSQRNLERCVSPDGFNHPLDKWSLSDWAIATLGELGEAANIVKKLNRVRDGIKGNNKSESELLQDLADEIADTAIYLDLFAQAIGKDLEIIREEKFQKTNKKIGYVETTTGL